MGCVWQPYRGSGLKQPRTRLPPREVFIAGEDTPTPSPRDRCCGGQAEPLSTASRREGELGPRHGPSGPGRVGGPEASVPPAVPALRVAALVEGGHGLVGRARLDLHEVGAGVLALGAGLCGRQAAPGGEGR